VGREAGLCLPKERTDGSAALEPRLEVGGEVDGVDVKATLRPRAAVEDPQHRLLAADGCRIACKAPATARAAGAGSPAHLASYEPFYAEAFGRGSSEGDRERGSLHAKREADFAPALPPDGTQVSPAARSLGKTPTEDPKRRCPLPFGERPLLEIGHGG